MRFQKFFDGQGRLDCIVNLDAVVAAKPGEDGKMHLHTQNMSIAVDAEQFEKAVADKDDRAHAVILAVNRLVQAMDRLAVRIPTSIRMHM